jgi:FkbM family methyltransferase
MAECHSIALSPSDVVVDIGAYCGTYALWAAQKGVRLVRAYEPTLISFQALQRNAHGVLNLQTIRAAVVPDDRKEATFYLSRGLGVTNGLLPSKAKVPTRVPAISYAEAVKGATVIKIDIEGAEYALPILEAMPATVRSMIIDFHPLSKRSWIQSADRIIAGLRGMGFTDVITPNWSNGWTRAGSWKRG